MYATLIVILYLITLAPADKSEGAWGLRCFELFFVVGRFWRNWSGKFEIATNVFSITLCRTSAPTVSTKSAHFLEQAHGQWCH